MNEINQSEKKCIRKCYIIHLLLYALIIIFNFILLSKLIWTKKTLHYLYLSGSFFGIIYFIFPIIPFIFLLSNKIKKNNIRKLRMVTLTFCIIAVILGIFFSCVLMINAMESSDFCRECPFNLPISNPLNKTNCNLKICILNNIQDLEKEHPYEYICNYDPIEYFDEGDGPFKRNINENYTLETEALILCQKYDSEDYDIENEFINKYIDFCGPKEEYFFCKRFFEAKKYDIKEGYDCPEKKYIKIVFLFCILNIILNLMLSFIPWKSEINIYEKIISRLFPNANRMSNSLNSTKNNSKANNTLEEQFKKVPTEVIIVCNNIQTNINNINIAGNNADSNSNRDIKNKNNSNEEYKENEKNVKNRRNEKNEDKIRNTITNSNPQDSADIFIMKENKKFNKKLKNIDNKNNNDSQ